MIWGDGQLKSDFAFSCVPKYFSNDHTLLFQTTALLQMGLQGVCTQSMKHWEPEEASVG